MAIVYITGSTELLDAVGPLWEKLNAHHAERSSYFASEHLRMTYARRKAYFQTLAQSAQLRVDLAQDSETGRYVGYCVSAVTLAAGVVESIFIEADYRGQGIGEALMQRALAWMDDQRVPIKRVDVAAGNEEAFGFYARYSFRPRRIVLQQQSALDGGKR
jgi:ribosomal protein S18 acetylase RimI-like enzyme